MARRKRTPRLTESQIEKARFLHSLRTERSRQIDDSRNAKVTTDYNKWKRHMNRYDIPGVDRHDEEGFYLANDKNAEAYREAISFKAKKKSFRSWKKSDYFDPHELDSELSFSENVSEFSKKWRDYAFF